MRILVRFRMLAGCSHRALSKPVERLLGLLVLSAFACASWKIAGQMPGADFALAPSATYPVAPALPLTIASQPNELSPDGRLRFNAQFVSALPGQAVHAASIAELHDGGLLAVWFSGSREGAEDVTIQSARMNPATLEWGLERTLFDRLQLQRGVWRYVKKLGNPVVARAPDGSLWLWMVNVSLGGWAGSAITWSRSADEGTTWSVPRRLVTSPFLNVSTLVKGAPVSMTDGQVSLPVYHEFITKFSEVLRISSIGQVVDKLRIPDSQTSLQPVLLINSARQAQSYMRSGRAEKIMSSDTGDAGKTWTAARQTSRRNPDSALAGVVTNRGEQWLAINPNAGREALSLLSAPPGGGFDDGVPWAIEQAPGAGTPRAAFELALGAELKARGAGTAQTQAYVLSAVRQLCHEGRCSQEFSYPYLLQTRDGFVHLVYTWHRTRIKHVRFDPLQGGLTTPTVPVAVRLHANAPVAH